MNTTITIGELRRILRTTDNDDLTIAEARSELAEADRRDDDAAEHAVLVAAYDQYVTLRRQRGQERVQSIYSATKQAAITDSGGAISKERLHVVSAEAADAERVRFEVREPQLDFEDWLAAGSPDVHARAPLTGVGS